MFYVFMVLFFHDEIVFCFYGCFFMMKLGLKSKSIIILLFFSQLPTRGLNSFKFQVPDSPIYEKNKGAWEVGQAL